MSLIVAWILYPLVLAAMAAGWGALVEAAAGVRLRSALLIPLGMAAVIVVGGTLTAFSSTAPAATPVCAVGALAGLAWHRPWERLALPGALAAVAVLLAYGAPFLLSGSATFPGYLRLDDTATWFSIIDQLGSHGRDISSLPTSTYHLLLEGYLGSWYPLGSFVIPAVSRPLVATDIAWLFPAYLAFCAAGIAMCFYALTDGLIAIPWKRAAAGFVVAQPALLYGYYLWGGIKEMTAALLVIVGLAALDPLLGERPRAGRATIPLAVSAGALVATLGIGAVAWIAPAGLALAGAWLWRGRHELLRRSSPLLTLGWLEAASAAAMIPLWTVLGRELAGDNPLFKTSATGADQLGNLISPLSPLQLGGIWLVGDFRRRPPSFPTGPLLVILVAACVAAVFLTLRRRRAALGLYVLVGVVSYLVTVRSGATPWINAKTLAISSPAILAAGMTGAVMLWERVRWSFILPGILAVGVLACTVLGYHDVLLAPRDRLADLQHIGTLLGGRGPTFINDYEIYGDRHFDRLGAPIEPAEYRPADLPTSRGVLLVKTAYADLDSFPLSTLLPYRSIVTRSSPVESRPPSIYQLVWAGRYYTLWQRPAAATQQVLLHVPLGDQATLPYCGAAENSAPLALCSASPAAVPPCPYLRSLAATATRLGGELVAYQRPNPIIARGDQTLWPAQWAHDPSAHTLTPTTPGTLIAHIGVAPAGRYELWLGGSFTRGFEIGLDGRSLGTVRNEISDINGYVPISDLHLAQGVHTVTLNYPHAGLAPGSGDNTYTTLSAIALEPLDSRAQMLRLSPRDATGLCGRPLDWIEVVRPGA